MREQQWDRATEMILPLDMAICYLATLTVSGPNHCPTFRSHIMPPCAIRCIPKIAFASSANQLSTSTYFLGGGLSLTIRQSRLR